jgi:hypothetical protein
MIWSVLKGTDEKRLGRKKENNRGKACHKNEKRSSASKKAPVPEKKENIVVKRGVGAVVCLLLSLFSFIGF